MPTPTDRPVERLAFAALVGLTLAPVALTGLWRALATALDVDVDSAGITGASVGVAAIVALACATTTGRPAGRWAPVTSGALAAALSGGLLGRGLAAIAAGTALAVVAVLVAALVPWCVSRLPRQLDGLAAHHKVGTVAMLVLGLVSVDHTTRLATFMGDASRPDLSLAPDAPFFVHHSCLTAYVEADRLAAAGVTDLYDPARWPDLNGTSRSESALGPYAPFALDAFAYPPAFLLAPRLLLGWTRDFPTQRAVWFSLEALLVAAGLWVVATHVGGVRPLLLAPAVWISPPLLGTLQVGNAHAAVIVVAMLALVAFERGRPALGGAMLAFATVSKLSPGILILFLLARRRYADLLWTAAFGIGFVALGALVVGVEPLIAFVTYELPRLGSGEALTFLAEPDTVVINLSPFGIPFKIAALGVAVPDPWALARLIGRGFTVGLVALTLVAAPHDVGRRRPQLWAAVLTLSALQSPLAPGYATIPLLWLFSLRAGDVHGPVRVAALGTIWAVLAIVPTLPPAWLLGYTLAQQLVVLGVAVYALVGWPPALDPTPAAADRARLVAAG